MKTETLSRVLLLALVLTSTSGCATRALWSNRNLDAFREPASDPRLSLYSGKKDFLVIYDEYSERSDSVHRRAYWLDENKRRTEQRQCPLFVDARMSRGLTSVPVFLATDPLSTGQQPTPHAVVSSNNAGFTLFSGDAAAGSYLLPVYDDGRGEIRRVMLTPLTVTADVAIVGGFIGYLYLQGIAEHGGTYSYP